MAERGIFNQGPLFKRQVFIRSLIIVTLIGIFIFLFQDEITQVLQYTFNQIRVLDNEYQYSLLTMLWNGLVFLVCFFAMLILVSQYILPVQTEHQRRKVFDRIFAFLVRQHGPAVFIKGGKEIAKKSELLSSKPGVAFIDITSAIALEKQSTTKPTISPQNQSSIADTNSPLNSHTHLHTSPYRGKIPSSVRIAGPGIAFTESGEKIRGVIDLRPQIRTRRDVHAYTREGIEIRTSITTMFTVGQPPEIINVVYEGDQHPDNLRIALLEEKTANLDKDSDVTNDLMISGLIDGLDTADKQEIHRYINDFRKTGGHVNYQSGIPKDDPSAPFLFDPERIFKAIYASSLDIRDDKYKEWTDLPTYIATEIFRNLIAGEIYDQIYFPSDQTKFPLRNLKQNFSLMMRHQGVLAFRFYERKDNLPIKVGQEWIESRYRKYPIQELFNPKILRVRGIKMIHASFSDLTPVNPGIRQQLLDTWSAYWDKEVEFTRIEQEKVRTQIINNARKQAQTKLKGQLLELLGSSPVIDDALALRMLQALEAMAVDPKTQQLLPEDAINMLRNIWEWLWNEGQYAKFVNITTENRPAMPSTDVGNLIDEVVNLENPTDEEILLSDNNEIELQDDDTEIPQ